MNDKSFGVGDVVSLVSAPGQVMTLTALLTIPAEQRRNDESTLAEVAWLATDGHMNFARLPLGALQKMAQAPKADGELQAVAAQFQREHALRVQAEEALAQTSKYAEELHARAQVTHKKIAAAIPVLGPSLDHAVDALLAARRRIIEESNAQITELQRQLEEKNKKLDELQYGIAAS